MNLLTEDQPKSSGMTLAYQHQLEAAPFFMVEREYGSIEFYTDHLSFFQEVLNYPFTEPENNEHAINSSQDLDSRNC